MAMAMTAEERRMFHDLQDQVAENKKAMQAELSDLKDKYDAIDKKINSILTYVKGIAIGLILGALIFGVLSINDVKAIFK